MMHLTLCNDQMFLLSKIYVTLNMLCCCPNFMFCLLGLDERNNLQVNESLGKINSLFFLEILEQLDASY